MLVEMIRSGKTIAFVECDAVVSNEMLSPSKGGVHLVPRGGVKIPDLSAIDRLVWHRPDGSHQDIFAGAGAIR